MKTREEVEQLKQSWVRSSNEFDLVEDALGYEEYRDELLVFKAEQEKIWHNQYLQQQKNAPAFPSVVEEEYGDRGHKRQVIEGGLTKREYFTAMAMQGLLCNWMKSDRTHVNDEYPHVHELAVSIADDTIAALNK